MKKFTSILLCIVGFTASLKAQNDTLYYRFNFETPVINQNLDTLVNPWGGGLNQPQFSMTDLNGDGKKDLVLFDRSGSSVLTYIAYLNKSGYIKYTYDPQYEILFPKSEDIMLLKDHNGDGLEDCWYRDPFDGYIKLANNNGHGFDLPNEFLKAFNFGSAPFDSSNFVLWIGNHPAVTDIDNDGDIDFLSTDYCGTELVYYLNSKTENKLSADSRPFEIPDRCLGYLGEDANGLKLGATCLYPNKYYRYKKKHCASKTLGFFDLDGDGDNDLFFGNSEDLKNSMTIVINGKKDYNLKIDSFIRIDTSYLSAQTKAAMPLAPAAYFHDIDQDGKIDLILSGNESRKTDYPVKETKQVTYLKNYSSTGVADFRFETGELIVGDMIDHGSLSQPVLYDIDADNDLDLIVVTNGDHYVTKDSNDRLFLYENIGTNKTPIFKFKSDNLWNIANDSLVGMHITFGDLNNDDKPEMLVGTANGTLALYENIGSKTNQDFRIISKQAYGLFISSHTTPQIVDVNRDGKNDLLVGTREGIIYWYENNGTKTQASFILKSDSFGKIIINEIIPSVPPRYNYLGYSVPFLTDLDKDGKYDLVVGGYEGYFKIYRNVESNLNGTFKQSDSIIMNQNGLYNHDLGSRIKPFAADLNNDSIAEIITGNSRGGLNYFKGYLTKKDSPGFVGKNQLDKLLLYPNPAFENIRIGGISHYPAIVAIYSSEGKSIIEIELNNSNDLIDLGILHSGFYFVKCNAAGNTLTSRLVVIKK